MDDVKIYNLDRRYADLFDKEDMIAEEIMAFGKNTAVVSIFKQVIQLHMHY